MHKTLAAASSWGISLCNAKSLILQPGDTRVATATGDTMANRNPNITGGNLAPVQERTGDKWRYTEETVTFPDGTTMSYPSYDNCISDNDDHKDTLPIKPVVNRK